VHASDFVPPADPVHSVRPRMASRRRPAARANLNVEWSRRDEPVANWIRGWLPRDRRRVQRREGSSRVDGRAATHGFDVIPLDIGGAGPRSYEAVDLSVLGEPVRRHLVGGVAGDFRSPQCPHGEMLDCPAEQPLLRSSRRSDPQWPTGAAVPGAYAQGIQPHVHRLRRTVPMSPVSAERKRSQP